ncbi:ATP-binding protein [Nocardiopsis sediminis]|uniref:ATP-binding protein n=1 Tax=Nocardiopsis sediminis TaxID=1778267 RepID=A0ABV8FPA8_9ACTN
MSSGAADPPEHSGGRDPAPASRGNTLRGDTHAVVQAGTVHGGVHIAAASATGPVPRQLPMAVPGFVNRESEIAALDALLPGAEGRARGTRTAVVISTIGGPPGTGKTALAVHWAHRVRSHHPDGDLYVNMRGHGPGPRLGTSEALDSLLRALDVPPERIPLDLDSRSALYRSLLDGKRMLLVIDDAVSADQVRPLIPAAPGCTVVVTARSSLPGLVTREGARRTALGPLSTAASLDLLRATAGNERIESEPEAARALVAHCAHLPLALRIVAERLLDRPDETVSALVGDLAAEDRRLDALGSGEDDLSDVRAVFSASYAALAPDSARLFRRLGLHPGPEFSTSACATAADLPERPARTILDGLVRANLVQRTGRDHYRLHDLLRLYAVERFREEEAPTSENAVLRRYGGWYLAAARNAALTIVPNFPFVDAPDDPPAADPTAFPTVDSAATWFERERANLTGCVRSAIEHGQSDLAWRIADTASGLFEQHGRWHELRELHRMGVAAARSDGHRFGEARNLLGLGDSDWLLGDPGAALEHYAAALAAAREVGDAWVEGFALRMIGHISWERDRDSGAPELLRQAVTVFRSAGERRGEGMALLSLAACDRDTGRFDAALAACRTAIGIFTGIDDRWTIAWARCSTAAVLHAMERHTDAVTEYTTAVAEFRELQDQDSEAVALIGAGDAHTSAGDTGAARAHLGAALDLLSAVDDPRVPEVEGKLAALP